MGACNSSEAESGLWATFRAVDVPQKRTEKDLLDHLRCSPRGYDVRRYPIS